MNSSLVAEEIHAPTSPYAGKRLTPKDHLAISGFWLATNAHWGALLVVMLPAEIAKLTPDHKANALGLFTGIGAIFAILCPLLVGPFSDRCISKWGRRRPYIVWGTLINIVGLAMMAASIFFGKPLAHGTGPIWLQLLKAPVFLESLFGYMVVQFGNNVATAAYMGVLPDLVPDDQRGIASGYYAIMCQAGTLVGAIGAGLILGKQPPWIQYSFLFLLLAIVTPLSILNFTEGVLTTKSAPIRLIPYLKSLWINPKVQPDFFWVWITRFFVMLGFYAIQPFINYFLRDVLHSKNPNGQASILIGVILIAASISGFLGGSISDKIGRKKVVFAATATMAVLVLMFAVCHTFLSTILVGIGFGLGFGAYTSVDWALGTDVLPDMDHAAKHMAVWHVSMTVPQSLAPPISGTIIGFYVLQSTKFNNPSLVSTGYNWVFVFCAVSFVLGAVFLKNIKSVN